MSSLKSKNLTPCIHLFWQGRERERERKKLSTLLILSLSLSVCRSRRLREDTPPWLGERGNGERVA